jgi:peroxiredoxin Q/BCP
MQGHQRNLSAYEALNARVVGVSRDDVATLKYWVKHLRISFPLLSNISGYVGNYFGAEKSGQFVFERLTVIVDKKGIIRYMKDGSPNYEEILAFLKKLNEQESKK